MAYLGFLAVALIVLAPLFTILIMGARSGQGRKKNNSSWSKGMKASPAEFVSSFTKIRPK